MKSLMLNISLAMSLTIVSAPWVSAQPDRFLKKNNVRGESQQGSPSREKAKQLKVNKKSKPDPASLDASRASKRQQNKGSMVLPRVGWEAQTTHQ